LVTQQKSQDKKSDSASSKKNPASTSVEKASPTPTVAVVGAARTAPRRVLPSRSAQSAEPETVTFSIDLPAHVHEAPDHEVAVAIHDVPVDPGVVDPGTTSVVIPELSSVTTSIEAQTPPPPAIVPLPEPEPAPYTRRESLRGEPSSTPETAAMLTAERLIDKRKKRRPAPEGFWPQFFYQGSLHIINIGDSVRVKERKALDARIHKQFEGGARFVPVLTRKGGVGKTTVTTLLGMALADVRDDRVIAIDANPDRGTLAERVNKQTRSTVRDVVTNHRDITTFSEFQTYISRDETRLDILASDTDPLLAQAFDEFDYNVVADEAARYYSIVLTDCGTGIVHSVMKSTLERADEIVIVSGGSVDEARLASETLTWLESNGYGALARNAVVALNTATHATNLVKLEEIEAHFNSRVRAVVRLPYDPHLAAGAIIKYDELKPLTIRSSRELAALVMDGLPVRRED
jgi:MinD-like ATPase involved in chromosome partitioning or flagellar assembly